MIAEASIPVVNLLAGLPAGVSDPVKIEAIQTQSEGDIALAIEQHWGVLSRARVVVVDVGWELQESELSQLARIASHGVRVVVCADTPVRGFPPMLVLQESQFTRAAVASIYGLEPHRKAILMTPLSAESKTLRGIVRHAMAWRASWQEVENGDMSAYPTT